MVWGFTVPGVFSPIILIFLCNTPHMWKLGLSGPCALSVGHGSLLSAATPCFSSLCSDISCLGGPGGRAPSSLSLSSASWARPGLWLEMEPRLWAWLEVIVTAAECDPVSGAFHRGPAAVTRVVRGTERQTDLSARLETRSQLCQSLAVWPGARRVPLMSLTLLVCRVERKGSLSGRTRCHDW